MAGTAQQLRVWELLMNISRNHGPFLKNQLIQPGTQVPSSNRQGQDIISNRLKVLKRSCCTENSLHLSILQPWQWPQGFVSNIITGRTQNWSSKKVTESRDAGITLLILSYCFVLKLNEFDKFSVSVQRNNSPTDFQEQQVNLRNPFNLCIFHRH